MAIGSLAGTVVGAAIGAKAGKRRKMGGSLDIATAICVSYPLVLSVLILLGGVIRGKFSGMAVIGAAFAGPMVGLLVGGLLDRLFESARGRIRKES